MSIKALIVDLEKAVKPIVRSYKKSEDLNILLIGFKQNMVLASHKTLTPARLLVLSGTVIYKEGDSHIELGQYDEVEIPVDTLHEVMAVEDSLCMLIK